MFKVYVSEFVDNGIKRWGLFYEDKRGNKQHLTEDFKHLVFDTETDAKEKLHAIETERKSENAAEAFSLAEAISFAESRPHYQFHVKDWC